MTPLFHPYYIEYGRDKIEFFEKLKMSHRIGSNGYNTIGYQFFILPQDFGYWYTPQTVLYVYLTTQFNAYFLFYRPEG